MGTIFIVATPIGNLDDITIRAIRILLTVDVIACEDTRTTSFLLKSLRNRFGKFVSGIKPITEQSLISYYEQNEQQRIPEIINALKNGLSVALVSDAGTPLISDPGFKLIRECLREGIRVESIPGPSSVISALVCSGLPTDKFLFLGYPPQKPGHRKQFYQNIALMVRIIGATVILFEAPHKLLRTLGEMKDVFGDIDICLARELTKIHEEVLKGRLSEFASKYKDIPPKGEFVVLFTMKGATHPYV